MYKALIAQLEDLARETTNTTTTGSAPQAMYLPPVANAAKFLEEWKKAHASEIAAEQAAKDSASQTLLERHFAKLRIPAPPEIQATLVQIRRGGGLPAYMRTQRQGEHPCHESSTTSEHTTTENSETANTSAPSTSATPTAHSPGQ